LQIPTLNSPLSYPQVQAPLGSEGNPQISATKKTGIPTNDGLPESGKTDNSQQGRLQELSEAELRQIKQLQASDREVRAHEAAHMAAAGGLVRGGASFSYQAGPDGRAYAIGGEVSIDTSPVRDNPQATIQKAQTIRAAALAPANPSSADHAVAAAASQLEAAARIELAAKRTEEQRGHSEEDVIKSTEASADESAQKNPTTTNADSAASNYQDAVNPNAPSDQIGQLLNTSA